VRPTGSATLQRSDEVLILTLHALDEPAVRATTQSSHTDETLATLNAATRNVLGVPRGVITCGSRPQPVPARLSRTAGFHPPWLVQVQLESVVAVAKRSAALFVAPRGRLCVSSGSASRPVAVGGPELCLT